MINDNFETCAVYQLRATLTSISAATETTTRTPTETPRKRQIMFTVPNTQRTQYNWAANRFDTIPDSNQIISLTHIICHFKKGLADWRSFASFWWIEKFLCHDRHHRVEKTTKTTILCSNRFFAQQTRRLRLWYLFNTNECFPSPVHCTRKCFQK